ncbi:MAG: UvrB/UvrC motif-containing protein [Planctomycetes bacterium]|nr:UvrB/UvrC motif-containing protein [Planctomycetota bacterium]
MLYVGKAINLRARLSNYFQPLRSLHERTRHMVLSASGVEWTVVGSDFEALQLEYTWIKEFSPPYNVKFRDDKTYPYMAVTLADEAPRVMVTRNHRIPGARYFGPYPKIWAVRETIDLMTRAFPIRTCSDSSYARAMATGRPCFPGQIGRCGGPCSGRVTIAEHREIVDQIVAFMASHDRSVITHLQREMREAAAAYEYEVAAELRDRIQALENVLEKSAVVLPDSVDTDVFGIEHDELAAAVQQFIVRGGRIRGTRNWVVDTEMDVSLGDLVESVLETAYETAEPPREIVVPALPDDAPALETWLGERRERGAVTLRVPAGWLATARFPIVVDPLISLVAPFTNQAGNGFERVEIERDDEATGFTVMVAYVQSASGIDSDVSAFVVDDAFANAHSAVFSDITSTWDSDGVSCAYVGGANRWAISLRRFFINSSIRVSRLRFHGHPSGSTAFSSSVLATTPPTNENEWNPEIGGIRSNTAGTQALVVFQREDNTSNGGNFTNTSSSDVWGMLLDMSSANGTAGQPFAIHASPFSDSEYPAVNRVAPGGASFSWVCAYQTYYNLQAGDDWDVVARRIGNDGSVTTSVFQSDLGLLNTHHQMRPRIAAVDRSYAILFTTTDLASTPGKTTATGGKEVRIERFDWTHGYAAPNPGADRPPVVLQSSTVRDLHCGAVAADANDFSHFAAAWYQRSAVPAPYYARIGYDGGITESGQIGNAVLVNDVACTFDQDHNTFLLVSDDDALPTRLNGALLGYNPAVPESLSGIGCNPALVYWVGTQQIGAEPVLAVSNALTGAGHLMLVSFATADVPVNVGGVAPNCRLLVDVTGAGYLGTLAFQIGPTVSWQISLPSWLPPLTLHFQDWILAGNQLSSTQRLTVPLVR